MADNKKEPRQDCLFYKFKRFDPSAEGICSKYRMEIVEERFVSLQNIATFFCQNHCQFYTSMINTDMVLIKALKKACEQLSHDTKCEKQGLCKRCKIQEALSQKEGTSWKQG